MNCVYVYKHKREWIFQSSKCCIYIYLSVFTEYHWKGHAFFTSRFIQYIGRNVVAELNDARGVWVCNFCLHYYSPFRRVELQKDRAKWAMYRPLLLLWRPKNIKMNINDIHCRRSDTPTGVAAKFHVRITVDCWKLCRSNRNTILRGVIKQKQLRKHEMYIMNAPLTERRWSACTATAALPLLLHDSSLSLYLLFFSQNREILATLIVIQRARIIL